MRKFAAIALGKTIFGLSRSLGKGGGFAAPGLYALKLDPKLISKLSSNISTNIIITGTNGKTTTSRLLAHFAKSQGLKVIRNHTGSNLERGIASTLISNYTLTPKPSSLDLGIWELDEAAFNTVAPQIKPKIIVFLNIFRDQLDRYGEIDTILRKWGETLKQLDKNTIVLVNGDDANLSKLSQYFKGKIQKFGLADHKITGESNGEKRTSEKLDFEAKDIRLNGLTGSKFTLQTSNNQQLITVPLPGIYHIYDFLAAFAVSQSLAFNPKKINSSLKDFSPAFGRVEKLDFGYIFLIKNPAGANQIFETISPQIKKNDRLFLALNDNLADGTDVSWIWDAEFEKLKIKSTKLKVFVSGTRAFDLANRLKYAGFDTKSITIQTDLNLALKQAKKGLKGQLFILPTYTAMLELQSILTKSGIKKAYWREDI